MGKTIGDIKQERGIGGPPMLKGSDIKGSSVKIKIKELREAPKNFNSPAIIDLAEPIEEKESMALNITNLRALAALVGFNSDALEEVDFDQLAKRVAGKSFTLHVLVVNDPKKKKMVRSLFFTPPE